ncbi:MAG: DUF58 domain-containing protein [Chloroflexota bacterium]
MPGRLIAKALRSPLALIDLGVRNYNLVCVLVAFTAVCVLAGVTGEWIFYRGAYIIGGLIPLCFVWSRIMARGLSVEVERTNDRLQVGQEAETRLRLKSNSMFTKLWLEVEDQTTMPGAVGKTVVTLAAKSARNWRVTTHCRRRGVYSSGPVRITTGDPFGLFRTTRMYGDRQRMLVLPQPEELPYFYVPGAQLPGEGVVHKRTHYVTPNASGVREYYPGDSYNRIHWKSTARLGRLMVRTFEMDPTSNIWLIVDLDGMAQAGIDDESTEEYAIRIAASLAYRFVESNRMIGLMMDGAEKIMMDPIRGAQQYSRILESLAVAEAAGTVPLSELLQQEGRRLGRHTTAIIITPSVDPDWVSALGLLLQQGCRVAAVLLDAESFGKETAGPMPTESLAAMNVVTYVVRAQSDISLMLGPAGIVGDMQATERPVTAGVR